PKDKPAQKPHKEGQQAAVNAPAPAFALRDLQGKEHSLEQYRGKIVVLEWFNPQCPYVQKHHRDNKTMANLWDKYQDKDVVWLAVATGKTAADTGALADAKNQWSVEYPILLDPEGQVARVYGAKTTPHMYVINKDGVLVYAGAIDNDRSAKRLGDVNYVEQALEATLRGETVEHAE